MLNRLLHGPGGFAWGVRASAFLTLGLLVAANLLMTTRLPATRKGSPGLNLKGMVKDVPYMVAVVGCVFKRVFFFPKGDRVDVIAVRIFLIFWGLFLPCACSTNISRD